MGDRLCPACASAVAAGDAYCEACGQDLASEAAAGPDPGPAAGPDAGPGPAAPGPAAPGPAAVARPAGVWLTSADTPEACPACGAREFGPEGYCEACGQRRGSAADHTELDLGTLAAVTDRGLRHHRNEDAVGIGTVGDRLVAVVCDGVSSSVRPDAASTGAAAAATAALIDALSRQQSPVDAIVAATRAAQAAATLAAGAEPGSNPPASTFVCAVVADDAITVGWVGDSRAYWLPDHPADGGGSAATCLTVDDTVAARYGADLSVLASGESLVRWLGADAPDTTPHLRSFTPSGPGRLLVCSDGLYKYRPDADQLAALAPRDAPLPTAAALVRFALDCGGADNITVALLPFPPDPAVTVPADQAATVRARDSKEVDQDE